MKFRKFATAALTLGLMASSIGVATADDISNNLDGTVDAAAETMALAVGGPNGSTTLAVTPVNGDGKNGCNLTASSTLVVGVASSNTAVATVSPSSVTFTSCGSTPTLTVTPVAAGSSTIALTQTSNTSGGTFDLAPATFSVSVTSADETPPVIARVVSGTLGANGWYTSNVSVAWTVSDPESAVVIDAGCGTQNFTAETTGVTSSCSAHSAGGPAASSVDLKIDKTGPSASLSPSGTLGTNDWYTSDVSVTTSGTDNISGGVACTADQDLTSATTAQTVYGSCTNAAGLVTNATPITVKIDKTGPTAVLTPSGTTGSNGWFTSAVDVTTSGSDDISGPVTCDSVQSLALETNGTVVNGSCKNDAGLSTNASPITVKIDKSNPTASLSPSGTLGSGGWYIATPVIVSTNGADTVSNPASCTTDQSFSDDTAGTEVNGSCTNNAGLEQHADPITIKIDQSAPVNVELSVTTGTLGNNGWYTTDVVVHASGEDPISGVTCSEDTTVSAEGTTTVTGSCTNGAGQTTDATALTIKIDKSAPTIVATASTASGPYSSGTWTNEDVTVHFTCTDGVSDIATCPADVVVSAETAGKSVSGTATDKAGHSATSDPIDVKLDKTAPSIVHVSTLPAANDNGWNKTDVTVTWSCTDALSGEVASGDSESLVNEGSGQSATGTCADLAGNTASDIQTGISIDKTAPEIAPLPIAPAANANGWNKTDVTVTWSCTDDLSGAVSSSDSETLSTEGAGQSATGTCTDRAGNNASDTQTGISIDKTVPAVSLVGGPADGATYIFGSVPSVPTCSAFDGLSGLNGPCSVNGYSVEVGTHTVTASATDRAGNANSASATYTVSRWTLNGFYQPVDMWSVVNTVKSGSTVPLKFEVFAGSTELTNTSIAQWSVRPVVCTSNSSLDDIELVTTGGTSFRYDSTGGQFIYNWQTPKNKAGSCYEVAMTTTDGSSLVAKFKLK